jgi:hypothetical protein
LGLGLPCRPRGPHSALRLGLRCTELELAERDGSEGKGQERWMSFETPHCLPSPISDPASSVLTRF